MSERDNQAGDTETAVCHVCDQRFGTQEELAKHLIDAHPDDLLGEVVGD
ncbi:MAG TPA: hypothetical protein VHW68_13685 [Actinomycetota bacterium]|jgi:hypothetical protein|nr:hypothetical protein [Actinomycetota bacterium]